MSCSNPLRAYRSPSGDVSFCADKFDAAYPLDLPCGKCYLCLKRRCSDWSVRYQIEARLHAFNACVCLTYDAAHLPAGGSVCKRDVQLFIKRLREYAARVWGQQFRFAVIAEHSPAPLWRPHYHGLLFGLWPVDAEAFGNSQSGHQEFSSAALTRLWGKGRVTFQFFSAGAASYMAGHQASKERRGGRVIADPVSGEVLRVLNEEFHLVSTRPGIGAAGHDVGQALAFDFSVGQRGGKRAAVPRYFDKLTKRAKPSEFSDVVEARVLRGVEQRRASPQDFTAERLATREECARLERERLRREGVK